MSLTNDLEHQLQPIASLLIQAGADLTLCDSNGYSACSLIFQSQKGLVFLSNFVLSYVDIFTLQHMEGVDLWVLAALARASPSFQQCLQAQLSEFRTPAELSTSRLRAVPPAIGLDVPSQVAEVKNAKSEVRQSFLRLLCAKGTLAMIKPFLDCGLNLDECGPSGDRTYIRVAAKSGSVDVVAALAEAGASLDTYSPWMSESETIPASSAVDDLIERWYSIRLGRPEYTGNPEAECWILKDLLRNPTFNASDSIFFALGRDEDPFTYRCLLEAECGRRDGMPPSTRARKALGSEVIWAIRLNSPIAALLVEHGLGVECEDRLGFSALLHALDRGKGRIDFTEMLIRAGADLMKRTASGFTPLEFAKKNLNAQHPRYPRRDGIIGDRELRAVSLQEDREAYDRLKKAIRERHPSTQSEWSNGKITPAIHILDVQD